MNTPKKKIENIKDEVKELHPLLEALLPKLPGVVSVEYTHGRDEMGADFVFSREDLTLGDTDYIGVVAKSGQIGQDFSDVERQIEECQIERFFMVGKKKIILNEIWVIATKNITSGAQRKINHKYSHTKIKFITGAKLSELVDEHLPVYWRNVKVEIGNYLETLKRQNREEDNRYSLIQLSDENFFYIEQDIQEYPREYYRKNTRKKNRKPKTVPFQNLITNDKFILIEGGAGAGKTKLLRKVIDFYTDPDIYNEHKTIPLLIPFKDLADKFSGDVSAFVQQKIPKNVKEADEEIRYLVLIDGLDEKNLEGDEQINTLEELTQNINTYENIYGVATSRYLKALDKTSALENAIIRYEIPPLKLKKTIEFIKTLCEELNLSSRLLEDLKKSQLFRELPQSPIAAILLAKLINENPQELPSNISELYSQYTELILGRWDIDKGLQTLKEYRAMEKVLTEASKIMLDNEMPYLMLGDTKNYIEEYLSKRNLGIEADILFEKLIARCDLVIANKKENTFEFKHRTFAEYFYALGVQDKPINLEEKAFNLYWANTVFFYLGLKRDCPDLLKTLIDIKPASESERWLRVINLGNYFLSAHASPYNIISEGVTQVAIDAAYLFDDVIENKIESFFSKLPHMHVLYMMQYLIREGYSYDFFKTSIEESALRINDSNHPEKIKAYAIFLLNVAYIDMGETDSFDFLLEDYSKSLPLDLSLAIAHETERIEAKTALFKKHDAKIRKLIKRSSSLKAYIDELYNTPLKELQEKELPPNIS